MNNLTQNQKDAKADYLQRQLDQTIETYKAASKDERRAAIKQIDSFLPVTSDEESIFWLKFREKLERMNEFEPMHPDAFATVYLGGNSIFPQN